MDISDKRTFGILATITSAALFGFMPLFVITVTAGGGNSLTITFLRFLLPLVPLYCYLRWKKISLTITKSEFFKLFLLAVFGYGATPLLLFASYNYIPSGVATTIHFCYPAFTILGCILFLKQKPQPAKLLAVFLSILGIILFYNGGGTSENMLLGMILAFVSGITYSFYVIYLEASKIQEMPTFKVIFYTQLIASILLFFFAVSSDSLTLSLTAKAWSVMIFMSIALCFISVSGFQIGVKYLGSSTTTVLSTFEPITSLLVGVLFLDETLYFKNIFGCIAIIAATIIIGKQK